MDNMRRIKKAKITFISLVPKGANRLPVLYKADGQIEFHSLTKMVEQGELLSVVYAPNVVDSQGDIAEAQVIKDMAHDFLKRGGKIDLQHNGEAVSADRAFVAESFIIAKGDERFKNFKDYEGQPVNVTGGWGLVIKIEDPELRKLYREGQWNGVSMFGTAQVEEVAGKSENGLLKAVRKFFGKSTEDENVDEIKELLQKMNARLDALEADKKAALEKAQKAAEEAKAKELETLKKQIEELKKSKQQTKEKPEEKVARLQKEKEEMEKKAEELKKELEELQKTSNQPKEKDKKKDEVAGLQTLSKEEMQLVELGHKMAKFVNGETK
jgi:hypothetical protein